MSEPLEPDLLSVSGSLAAQAGLLVELATAALHPKLAALDLSLAGFDLLSAVKAAGLATQADIARRLGVSPGTLSEAVKAAVGRGWVDQVPDDQDARLKRLRLTRSGGRVLRSILKEVESIEQLMLQGIPEDRAGAAREVLWAAIRNLARANSSPKGGNVTDRNADQ